MLNFVIGSIIIIGVVSIGWVLLNDILMPFLWEVASATMKSVFKALISKINRKDEENNM